MLPPSRKGRNRPAVCAWPLPRYAARRPRAGPCMAWRRSRRRHDPAAASRMEGRIGIARGMLGHPETNATRVDRIRARRDAGAVLRRRGRIALLASARRTARRSRARCSSQPLARRRSLWLFGAVHVGRALAPILAALAVRRDLVDSRDAFSLCRARLRQAAEVGLSRTKRQARPPGAYFPRMTTATISTTTSCARILKWRTIFRPGGPPDRPRTTRGRRFRQRLPPGVPACTLPASSADVIDGIDIKLPCAIAVICRGAAAAALEARAVTTDARRALRLIAVACG